MYVSTWICAYKYFGCLFSGLKNIDKLQLPLRSICVACVGFSQFSLCFYDKYHCNSLTPPLCSAWGMWAFSIAIGKSLLILIWG